MTEEKPNIDLGKYQSYQRKFPKRLIRYIIYSAVLLFLIFYGFKYLAELQEEKEVEDGIEIILEEESSNTLQ